MTTPIQHDHPDWARTVSAADIKVFQFSDTQNVASLSHGRFFVGNLPWLHVSQFVSDDEATLHLRWFDAPTGVNVIGNRTVTVRPNKAATGSFSNPGPWVEVVTIVLTPPKTVTVKLWQTLTPFQEDVIGAPNVLISQSGTAIAANSTVSFDADIVRWGWGFWTARLEGGLTNRIRLLARGRSGTLTLLDYTSQVEPVPSRLILLPSMPIVLEVFNNEASGRDLFASVLYHPGPY